VGLSVLEVIEVGYVAISRPISGELDVLSAACDRARSGHMGAEKTFRFFTGSGCQSFTDLKLPLRAAPRMCLGYLQARIFID
jgi:hypothetical protein